MSSKLVAACVVWACGAASAEITVTPDLVRTFEVGVASFGTRANPNANYSNVDTFTGAVVSNGGAQNVSGNVLTRMVADDLHMVTAEAPVTQLSFSISNLNTSAVTARARIRLYANDTTGVPGTLILGLTTTNLSLGPGSVSIFSVSFPATAVPQTLWAGIIFDNNGGTTGAGVTELNNLGQGVFNPPAIGTSADLYFRTQNAGTFLSSNPAGATQSGGAGVVGNFGWQVVPAPVTAGLLGAAGLLGMRRRR